MLGNIEDIFLGTIVADPDGSGNFWPGRSGSGLIEPDLDHDQDLTFLTRKSVSANVSYVVQFVVDNIHTKAGIKSQNLIIFIRGKVFFKGYQLY